MVTVSLLLSERNCSSKHLLCSFPLRRVATFCLRPHGRRGQYSHGDLTLVHPHLFLKSPCSWNQSMESLYRRFIACVYDGLTRIPNTSWPATGAGYFPLWYGGPLILQRLIRGKKRRLSQSTPPSTHSLVCDDRGRHFGSPRRSSSLLVAA